MNIDDDMQARQLYTQSKKDWKDKKAWRSKNYDFTIYMQIVVRPRIRFLRKRKKEDNIMVKSNRHDTEGSLKEQSAN